MAANEGALRYLREQQDRHAGILGCFRLCLNSQGLSKEQGIRWAISYLNLQ